MKGWASGKAHKLARRALHPWANSAPLQRNSHWNWLSLIAILSLVLVAASTQPVDPMGGQVYLYQSEDAISSSFSTGLTLDENQVISILMTQPIPFKGQLSLKRANDGVQVAFARADTVGQPLLVQSVPINVPSTTYTLEIRALEGTSGRYNLSILSSALEEEPYTGVSNDTTAQSLASSFISFEQVQRGAVHGILKDNQDIDQYSFRLNAGEHFEMVLSALNGASLQMEMRDPAGKLISISPVTGDNFNLLLAYDIPTNGTYSARVFGADRADASYNLVLVRGGAFSRQPNASFESAHVLTGMGGVLGNINVPPLEGNARNSFSERPLSVGFSSKGVFDYDPNGANSSIGLRLNDTEYLGSGGGQFSSFTFCYLQNSVRICPVHQYKDDLAPVLSYDSEDTLLGHHFAVVEGRTDLMHFRRVAQWHKDHPWIVVTTQLTNLSDTALTGVQALESVNPNPGGIADTNNDIIIAGGDGQEKRVALASNLNGAFILGTSDPRALASFVDGDISNPGMVLQTPFDPQGALSNLAMHLAFDLQGIPAGGRADYTFIVALSPPAENADAYRDFYLQSHPDGFVMGLDNVYAVDLEAGRRLLVHTMTPLSANLSTYTNRLDPVLKLYGPDRALLLVNDDCSDNENYHCLYQSNGAQIEYDITQSGRYYLQVTNSSKTSLYQSLSAASRSGGEYVMLVHHSAPPTITPIPDQSLDLSLGELLAMQVEAPDPDKNDTLIFSLGADAPQGAKIDEKTGFLEWQPTQVGNYPLTVIVQDQTWLQATYTFNVAVFRSTWPLYLPAVQGD